MARSPKLTGPNRKIATGPAFVEKPSDEMAADPAVGQAPAVNQTQGRVPSGPEFSAGGSEPSEDAIRRLAYDIWEREGRQAGRDQEYWHRAKELLRRP